MTYLKGRKKILGRFHYLLFTESDIGAKKRDYKDKNGKAATNEETESQLLLQEHCFKVGNY